MAERDLRARLTVESDGDDVLRRAADGVERLGAESADAAGDLERAGRAGGAMAKDLAHMEREVDDVKAALDKANRELDEFSRSGKNVQQVRSAFGGVAKSLAGMAGGLFVFDRLRDGAAAVAEAAERQEAALAQVEAAIESTGGAAGITSEELQKIAADLQQVTTVGDEVTLGMQSVLLTFTNLGADIFPRVSEVVLDVSERMGTDLTSAALQVGKALNDPVAGLGSLSEAGIQFTDAQKEAIAKMVEMGDTAGAQSVILKELETQFGGAARAAASTFGGAMEQAKNAAGDLLEKIGEGGLSAALKNVAEDIKAAATTAEGADFASNLGKSVGSLITILAGLVKQVDNVVTVVTGSLTGVGAKLVEAISGALAKVGGLLENVPGLKSFGEKLRREADDIRQTAEGVAEATFDQVAAALVETGDQASTTLDRLTAIWSDTATDIEASAGQAGAAAKGLGDATEEGAGAAADAVEQAKDRIADSIDVTRLKFDELGNATIATATITKDAAAQMTLEELREIGQPNLDAYAAAARAAAEEAKGAGEGGKAAGAGLDAAGQAAKTSTQLLEEVRQKVEALKDDQEGAAAASENQAASLKSAGDAGAVAAEKVDQIAASVGGLAEADLSALPPAIVSIAQAFEGIDVSSLHTDLDGLIAKVEDLGSAARNAAADLRAMASAGSGGGSSGPAASPALPAGGQG